VDGSVAGERRVPDRAKTLYTVSSDTPASAAILEIVVPENPSRTKRPVADSMIAARRRSAAS
jgi:hypothetical protein